MDGGCPRLGCILCASSGWGWLAGLKSFEEERQVKACKLPAVGVMVVSDLVGHRWAARKFEKLSTGHSLDQLPGLTELFPS